MAGGAIATIFRGLESRKMDGGLFRADRSVVCYGIIIVLATPATACSPVNPVEYMLGALALAERYWLASTFLCGVILCMDLCERRLSLALPIAGWIVFGLAFLVYRHPAWQETSVGGSGADCSVPLVDVAQCALGLMSALLGYRVFRAAPSKVNYLWLDLTSITQQTLSAS
jgi:hypothetical protein